MIDLGCCQPDGHARSGMKELTPCTKQVASQSTRELGKEAISHDTGTANVHCLACLVCLTLMLLHSDEFSNGGLKHANVAASFV
jgi:hypothetical protein